MREKSRPARGITAFTAGAFGAALCAGCGGLGAGGDAVESVRLVNQMKRIKVETHRSEETVDEMLVRLQPVLVVRSAGDAAHARERLGAATEACQQQAQIVCGRQGSARSSSTKSSRACTSYRTGRVAWTAAATMTVGGWHSPGSEPMR